MRSKLFGELMGASKEVNLILKNMFRGQLKPKELYDASTHLIVAGGKRLRPFLVLTSCELVGGNRAEALPAAAAIEFIHNFTLIHDDIMDQDDRRRGAPSVHTLWGVPMAITAGDMLFAKAYETLLLLETSNLSSKQILKLFHILTKATVSICEGQALDILFENRALISEQDYFNMISKKTASLIEASSKVGAIIGRGKASQVRRLGRFAYYSGLAFQIIDDLLGLTADRKILGKPVGSDIREGKKTLVLIHAVSNANKSQQEKIYSALGHQEASLKKIDKVIKVIQSLGSFEYTFNKAKNIVEKAKDQLHSFLPSPKKELLLCFADYIINREY